jgi:hypothetical protein
MPGRQLIADHRAELNEAERVVNVHVAAWRDGDPTPVGPALDAMLPGGGHGGSVRSWWPSGRRGGSQGLDARPESGDAAASAEGAPVLTRIDP